MGLGSATLELGAGLESSSRTSDQPWDGLGGEAVVGGEAWLCPHNWEPRPLLSLWADWGWGRAEACTGPWLCPPEPGAVPLLSLQST